MTGAEHYREAERLTAIAHGHRAKLLKDIGSDDREWTEIGSILAQAQVHATLALFDHVREIGDQLDARGLRNRTAQL